MKAIISDIHGNLEAFDAVLKEISRYKSTINEIIFLGDLVDYGADNIKVISKMDDLRFNSSYKVTSVPGNHDVAATQNKGVDRFRTEHGRMSLEITKKELKSDKSVPVLRFNHWSSTTVPKYTSYGGKLIVITHGKEVNDSSQGSREECLWGSYGNVEYKDILCSNPDCNKVILCGHTHVQGYKYLEDGTLVVNPGSVGQPRNGDNRAQFIIADDTLTFFKFMRVDYDIDKASGKIIKSRRPPFLATRLHFGI